MSSNDKVIIPRLLQRIKGSVYTEAAGTIGKLKGECKNLTFVIDWI